MKYKVSFAKGSTVAIREMMVPSMFKFYRSNDIFVNLMIFFKKAMILLTTICGTGHGRTVCP